MPDDEGSSIDKQLIEGSGSGGDESDAESKPTPVASSFSGAGAARTTGSVASGDAFLDAVKGVADDAAGVNADADVEQRPAKVDEDDQYAPAPAGHPTSSSSSSIISSSSQRRLSTSAAASTASAEPPKKPAPPPSRSSSRLSSRRHFTAEEEEEKAAAEAEAAAAAKHAADEARKKEIVAELEQLSETLKLFEREHDFFYTGLAGYGVLIGVVVFISSWAAGLSGSLSLTTGGGGGGAGGDSERQRVLKIVIAAAGVVSALFSTAQRAFSPSVRAEYYKSARDSYARLRKKVKGALGGDNSGSGEASLAALEATRRSVVAKYDELYERSPDIPVDPDGFPIEHGRISYAVFLGFGALFYPCAACCSPAGPKKPTDGRGGGGGGRDDFV